MKSSASELGLEPLPHYGLFCDQAIFTASTLQSSLISSSLNEVGDTFVQRYQLFSLQISTFLNPYLPEFSHPKNLDNEQLHSNKAIGKKASPVIVKPVQKNETPASGTSPSSYS